MGKKSKCCRGPRGPRGLRGPTGPFIPAPRPINIEKTIQFACDAWMSSPPPTDLFSSQPPGVNSASLFLLETFASGGGSSAGKIIGEISDTLLPRRPFPATQFYAIRVLNGIQGTDDTLGLLTLEAIANATRITIERVPSSSADFTTAAARIGFYATTVTYTIQGEN